MLEIPTYFLISMLEFYVGLKNPLYYNMLEIYVEIAFLCRKHRHTFWFLCWKYRHTYIFSKKSLKIAPFLMPEKVLQVSFARYAFCISIAKCIWLGAKSPKTPNIFIGAPLFDALFRKVLHFLAHLLKNGSTFWRTFFEDNLSCLGRCVTFWHPFRKSAPLFDTPFEKWRHFLTHLFKFTSIIQKLRLQ